MTTQAEAINQLRRALSDAGPQPSYHYATLARHRREWPTLWSAIDAVLRAETADV